MSEPLTDADLDRIERGWEENRGESAEVEQLPRLVAEVRRLRGILGAVTLGLRIASEEIGDPSWPDGLHPADVLSKYVLRPAAHELERLRSDEWLMAALEAFAPPLDMVGSEKRAEFIRVGLMIFRSRRDLA